MTVTLLKSTFTRRNYPTHINETQICSRWSPVTWLPGTHICSLQVWAGPRFSYKQAMASILDVHSLWSLGHSSWGKQAAVWGRAHVVWQGSLGPAAHEDLSPVSSHVSGNWSPQGNLQMRSGPLLAGHLMTGLEPEVPVSPAFRFLPHGKYIWNNLLCSDG